MTNLTDEEEADLEILDLANERGKFALQVGLIPPPRLQLAFERGLHDEWFRFLDVTPIACVPDAVLMRLFMLTPAGWLRQKSLRGKKEGTNGRADA